MKVMGVIKGITIKLQDRTLNVVKAYTIVEGSNSASGCVRACHAAVPGSIPVMRGRGFCRCTSRPSTLETVYLS